MSFGFAKCARMKRTALAALASVTLAFVCACKVQVGGFSASCEWGAGDMADFEAYGFGRSPEGVVRIFPNLQKSKITEVEVCGDAAYYYVARPFAQPDGAADVDSALLAELWENPESDGEYSLWIHNSRRNYGGFMGVFRRYYGTLVSTSKYGPRVLRENFFCGASGNLAEFETYDAGSKFKRFWIFVSYGPWPAHVREFMDNNRKPDEASLREFAENFDGEVLVFRWLYD